MTRIWQFGLPEEESFGFAQAVAAGSVLHVSGQVGVDGTDHPDDMLGQMRIAYARIGRLLEMAGASFDDVVEETIYVTDLAAASKAAKVARRDAYGSSPRVASTMIGVAMIGNPRMDPPLLVEIRCTAALGGASS